MATARIVQSLVDLFAAKEVGVFEFDDAEYTRQYEQRGDLVKYTVRIFQANISEYYQSLGIRNISNRISSTLFIRLIQPRLLSVMRLNQVKQSQTRREWIRKTLARCMDSVFYSLAPVIPVWQEKENLDRQSIALREEYKRIEKCRQQEVDWNKRKSEQDKKRVEVEQQFQAAMKEARENIQAVQGSLFQSSEATFNQFVHKSDI